jgi:superfamily II DNA or RNA helicase
MLELRGYQKLSMEGLRAGFANGHRSQMLYLPTGGGKTEIAISMLAAASDKGNKVAMVLDRRVLCDQTSERLLKYQIDHGVLMAGHYRFRPDRNIQICSAQTLEKRGSFPGLKLLIVDEAHNTRDSIKEFIKNNPQIKVVGLSASPFTKGLGDIYSNVVSRSTTRELVDAGSLSPLRVFCAKEIDMEGAKKVAGEWSQKDATDRGVKITGDIITEWVKKTHEIFGEPKKTIVFCAGVAHGEDLQKQFGEAGYNFVCLSYRDDDEFKQDAIKEFSKPQSDIHGLIATDILTKGFDQADVMIGISARPFTKSFSSHVQQLGRVMRPHESKDAAIWIDHSGNYLRFKDQWDALYSGGVDGLQSDGEKAAKEPSQKDKEAAKCPKCGALWPGNSDVCVHCGMVRVRQNAVVVNPGEMFELISNDTKKEKYSGEYKEKWYQGMIAILRAQGKNENRAFHLYKEKFKCEPAWKKIAGSNTIPEAADARAYLRRSNIAFAKSKK